MGTEFTADGVGLMIGVFGLIPKTTAGNYAFQWAQNTSNAYNTTIKSGSAMAILALAQ